MVAGLAERQHGVVARGQLLNAGVTKSAISRWELAGRLHRLHRGVYAVGHGRLTLEGRCMAAFLACYSDAASADGPDAAVSHASAAALWQMLPAASGAVHVSVLTANGRRARPGIVIHRPPSLSSGELTRKSGIQVTTPFRTLRDLKRTSPPAAFQRAVRRALDLRLVADEDLGDAPDLTRSELERMFLRLCRRRRLPAPEVNARVGGVEVDFLWRDARVVVETDGFSHHGDRFAFERDRARDARLQAGGYRVLRFTYRQVRDAPDDVAAALRGVLGRSR